MRTGTPASFAESKKDVVHPVSFAILDFASGAVFLNSTVYPLVFGGDTYLGVGHLGAIGMISEGSDLQARGITLTLSGIAPELISIALDEDYQGRDCKIYLGFIAGSHDHSSLIADPVQMGPFTMDSMSIKLGKEASITVSAESRLIRWDKPHSSRYTNEEQLRLYPADPISGDPADKGLEFVAQMAEKELIWGRTRA